MHHFAGAFREWEYVHVLPLGQAVSFFFVLSGFVLSQGYQTRLGRRHELRRYYLGRAARLWPLHLAVTALLILSWRHPLRWLTEIGPAPLLANLLLLQAWFPWSPYYFSLNAVSWSLSVEVFFYAIFPWLARLSTRRLLYCLAGCFLIVLAMSLISTFWRLPPYSPTEPGITEAALMTFSPLARLFEFVLGVVSWRLWSQGRRSKRAEGTTNEWGVVFLAILSSIAMGWISLEVGRQVNSALGSWLVRSGSCLSYALLVAVFASGQGALSRLLSRRPMIVLGESSFALYLVHQDYFNFLKRMGWVARPVSPTALALMLTSAVLLSILLWSAIEVPARRWILARFKG